MPTIFRRFTAPAACVATLLALTACRAPYGTAVDGKNADAPAANVDHARLLNADRDPGQWMMDGRNYNAQRYSPLKQINERNVSQL